MFNQHRILRVFKLITLLKSFPKKSIKRLAESLEISERSTYRYLDLMTELGFEVEKDEHNKYSLNADMLVEPFTKEESALIVEVLSVSAKNNPLVASIKAKLPWMEEANVVSNHVVSGHVGKLLTSINEAIQQKNQIIIQHYQSASSETISDRLVEPIGFTSNYQYLCAFEVESQLNKYFKLERMGGIEQTQESFQFTDSHKLLNPDAFGFNESGEKFPVKLQLSMRAQLWLRDDYPETAKYMSENTDGTWTLELEVNNLEPVNRILRSMPEEIKKV
ncbi:helix-turn-helix transcriptional regulator [Aquirufa ecclesiirivi]|uniref:helix-turn-helix transcriptional regulator n=1 Tax=Aquirufa ecclesiirivi TaxID=2715124 RepID=UPI003BB21E03